MRTVDRSTAALDARVGRDVADSGSQQALIAEIRQRIDAGTIPSALVEPGSTDMVAAPGAVPAQVADTLSDRALAPG